MRSTNCSKLEDIAARATSYHAINVREKVTARDESAGRGESRAGSHECALNTVAHGVSRLFRRNNGRGQGRGRPGNGSTIPSVPGNNNNGGYTSTNLNGN